MIRVDDKRVFIVVGVALLLTAAGVARYTGLIGAPPRAGVIRDTPIPTVFGVVMSKTSSDITLQVQGGGTLVVPVDATSIITDGHDPKTLADIAVGAIVTVTSGHIAILPPAPAPH